MHVRELLIETYAHTPPERVLDGLTAADAERRPANAPHSIAEIVAHMTFWQDWFHARCTGVAQPIPESASGGWPQVKPGAWPQLREAFAAGLQRLVALEERGSQPVTPPIELPPFANLSISDALVHAAQHNSHHLGQIISLRQFMGLWPPPGGGLTW